MNWVSVIGIMAALCTTLAFFPQAVKTIRTKQTKDLSLGMYSVFVSGTGLWLAYGLLNNDVPIILANAVTFVLAGVILIMKLRHG